MQKLRVIKNNYEFRRVYSKGKSFVSPLLVTYVLRKKYGGIRIGVTTGKKIGNAVCRSRARRVIRAAWRELDVEVGGSYDIVFVARTRTAEAGMLKVRCAMAAHMRSAGVSSAPEES